MRIRKTKINVYFSISTYQSIYQSICFLYISQCPLNLLFIIFVQEQPLIGGYFKKVKKFFYLKLQIHKDLYDEDAIFYSQNKTKTNHKIKTILEDYTGQPVDERQISQNRRCLKNEMSSFTSSTYSVTKDLSMHARISIVDNKKATAQELTVLSLYYTTDVE